MNKLGEFLKEARIKKGLSLLEVQKKTGITDSRLKRIEDGIKKDPSPKLLIKLASLYGLNLINLYLLADYLNESHLMNISIFENVENLNPLEIEHIQQEIDFLISLQRKEESNHEI